MKKRKNVEILWIAGTVSWVRFSRPTFFPAHAPHWHIPLNMVPHMGSLNGADCTGGKKWIRSSMINFGIWYLKVLDFIFRHLQMQCCEHASPCIFLWYTHCSVSCIHTLAKDNLETHECTCPHFHWISDATLTLPRLPLDLPKVKWHQVYQL